MGKILELPQSIVSKTAAGEVVERPASVVKELIENAIDAGSTYIKVDIQKGGTKSITVIDNGEGMDNKDLLVCATPHTTSKIYTEEDLERISTLGFRGEALASIASVSRLTIKSRTENSLEGNILSLEAGLEVKRSKVGMDFGTVVDVEDLFYNTPARKKFIKGTPTEFRQILDNVVSNAISRPEIGFVLVHNNKTILDLPGLQTREDRISAVMGRSLFSEMFPVEESRDHHRIYGFLSNPQASEYKRTGQFIFVNKRPVNSKVITSAVREGYGTLLDRDSHPPFVIFIEAPFDTVNVNIHPRKEEVGFMNEDFIFDMVRETVELSLRNQNLVYQTDLLGNPFDRGVAGYTFKKLKGSIGSWKLEGLKPDEIIQVGNLYLVVGTKNGILLVDQHAAHEKVLYEKLISEFSKHKKKQKSATLKTHAIFDLPAEESALLEENLDTFEKIGFDIEKFGEGTYKVRRVPELLQSHDIKKVILEFLEDISKERPIRDIDTKNLKTISYLACRSAVKDGDYLEPKEREKLIKDLLKTKTGYTCPHGRPAIVEVPLSSLEKMFKRR